MEKFVLEPRLLTMQSSIFVHRSAAVLYTRL
ncbi:hypothetical protein XVE_4073 [Xanthomonas vesicatoria ATCC 35937]|uniref:Uncharacterized protein n=1 Tax=Xanthomonas vesicatoria ATCC 35937 TaxID=925775 RepID=F0BIH0_9XANT|nr:hypothetical protein XVE_4073 [Xanthomonas vesicatoria ATCC 35937]